MLRSIVWLMIPAAMLAAAAAPAQQKPRSLLPPPRPDLPAPPSEAGPATPGQAKTGIDVDTLDAVLIDSVGTIDAASGGFDAGMWGDAPRRVIGQLISRIPRATDSRTLGALRRRLLLTAAHVPPPQSSNEETLLEIRARILFESGDLVPLGRLLAQVSAQHGNEALLQLQTRTALLADDLPLACAIASGRVGRSPEVYWQKVNVVCDALAGASGRVELGMGLLAELGVEDEQFFSLMQHFAVSAAEPPLPAVGALRPLDVAILRGARTALPVPADAAAVPLPLLRSYAGPGPAPAAARIAVLERAETLGLADSEDLARAYQSEEAGGTDDGVAAHYRAAAAWTSEFGQAEAILEAGAAAAESGRFAQAARLYAPLVRPMRPSRDLSWFAAAAARILLSVGDREAAQPWVALAEREAGLATAAQTAWQELWPLARLAAGDALTSWDPARLNDWRTVREGRESGNEAESAALLYGLLEALGEPLPAALWRELVGSVRPDAGAAADLVLLRAMAAAREGGRVGETVALVLIALGAGPLASQSPVMLCEAVRTLKAMAMDDDARRLALEVAFAHGL